MSSFTPRFERKNHVIHFFSSYLRIIEKKKYLYRLHNNKIV